MTHQSFPQEETAACTAVNSLIFPSQESNCDNDAIVQQDFDPLFNKQQMLDIERACESFSVTRRMCLANLTQGKSQLIRLCQDDEIYQALTSQLEDWMKSLDNQKEMVTTALVRVAIAGCCVEKQQVGGRHE